MLIHFCRKAVMFAIKLSTNVMNTPFSVNCNVGFVCTRIVYYDKCVLVNSQDLWSLQSGWGLVVENTKILRLSMLYHARNCSQSLDNNCQELYGEGVFILTRELLHECLMVKIRLTLKMPK